MGNDIPIVDVGVTTVEKRLTISDTVKIRPTGESTAAENNR